MFCLDVYMSHMCSWSLWKPEERVSDPLNLVLAGSCELTCRCWELNPGSLRQCSSLLSHLSSPTKKTYEVGFCDSAG